MLSEHDVGAWRRAYQRGERPAALPYGVDALLGLGVDLAAPDPLPDRPWLQKAATAAHHRLGYPVHRLLSARRLLPEADVVLALMEAEGAAAAQARYRRVGVFADTAVVIFGCWLADDLTRATPAGRAALLRRYRGADLITHFTHQETAVLVEAGFAPEQLLRVTSGFSHRYYVPDPTVAKDIDILSVGQDRGRDYATLFAAVEGTDLRVDVVCKPQNLAGLTVPDNVTLHGTVDLPTYRRMLQRARVVVVPTHVMMYPTGSSVALEAAATGACVVVSDTPGMRELFINGQTALMPASGDPDALRDALVMADGDPDLRARLGRAARAAVERTYNADNLWREVYEHWTALAR